MWLSIALLVAFMLMFVGLFLWLNAYNSEDGERYMKARMQGPFVPFPRSVDEDNEDKALHHARKTEQNLDFAHVEESLKQANKI